ncbi:DUF424 family protein [archaeon]|jgi:uncharacterized protein|nr:DUF424 family protein [archaeon]MBT6762120.1 DUF424 family protein [archaeon]
MEAIDTTGSSETFMVAVHSSPNGSVLVITDTEIIGQKFETEKLQLDLTKKFYLGEEMSADLIAEKINGCNTAHVTGVRAVAFVRSLDFIGEGKVLEIQGIPHAEVYLGV